MLSARGLPRLGLKASQQAGPDDTVSEIRALGRGGTPGSNLPNHPGPRWHQNYLEKSDFMALTRFTFPPSFRSLHECSLHEPLPDPPF